MTCPECENIIDRPDLPHSVRICPGCGREMKVHDVVKDGSGIRINKGERFVIPSGWLKLSLNPLKTNAKLYRPGMQWLVEQFFLANLPNKREDFDEEIKGIRDINDTILRESELLKSFDLDDPNQAEAWTSHLQQYKHMPEWWAFTTDLFYSVVEDAIKENDLELAIWATACAERCRAMLIYKQELEDVMWMGQSARRIIDLLNTWDTQKENSEEEYWQQLFNENPFALSQVFAVPLIFIKDRAYIGGMNIERSDARFVDYVFSTESSQEAVLIEIKTPKSRLLGRKYRGVYPPSGELSGAIVQVLDYHTTMVKNLEGITRDTPHTLSTFNPHNVLIIGNASEEIKSKQQRESFELFRSSLRNVEIITYDELFKKLDILANLFNLVRKSGT